VKDYRQHQMRIGRSYTMSMMYRPQYKKDRLTIQDGVNYIDILTVRDAIIKAFTLDTEELTND